MNIMLKRPRVPRPLKYCNDMRVVKNLIECLRSRGLVITESKLPDGPHAFQHNGETWYVHRKVVDRRRMKFIISRQETISMPLLEKKGNFKFVVYVDEKIKHHVLNFLEHTKTTELMDVLKR